MKQCVNLKPCPRCSIRPELNSDEFDMIFSLVCPKCLNEYGRKMEPRSTIDNPYISFETYKEVCELWQKGACADSNEHYIELTFE